MLKASLVALALVSSPAFAANHAVDVAKSTVHWEGAKKLVDSKHTGTLKLKSGSVTTDAKGAVTGGEFVIDINSLENEDLKKDPTSKGKLEKHLKSDDFFNAEKWPTGKFVIKTIAAAAKPDQYNVTGDLTLRDKTNPVTFVATIAKKGADLVATTEPFTIDRSLWDIKYNSGKFFNPAALGDKIIKDELVVKLDLVAR